VTPIKKTKERLIVIARWLVLVKAYGIIPMRLILAKKQKREKRMGR
jgi:hypothetical protein